MSWWTSITSIRDMIYMIIVFEKMSWWTSNTSSHDMIYMIIVFEKMSWWTSNTSSHDMMYMIIMFEVAVVVEKCMEFPPYSVQIDVVFT
jgi:hypothetical protein